MNKSFPFIHWLLTIIITPFIGKLFGHLFNSPSASFIGILEVYHITVIGSLILSLPTFLVYLLLFYRLRQMKMSEISKQIILLLVVVFGIVITLEIAGGKLKYPLILVYSSTTLVIGLYLLLKNKKINSNIIRGS
jgi:hypothetical protein